jgi:putative ABC transport system substrate-binding protein
MLEGSTMRRSIIGVVIILALGILSVPFSADAQQRGKVYRIGFLTAFSLSLPFPSAFKPALDAFWQQLRALGWVEGQNIVVEYRWAEGRFERLPALATELVQLKVDLILVWDGLATVAAKQATRTIPIVMAFSLDAVELGFVASLAHPGTNVTGLTAMTSDLNQKRLEILKETVPGSSRMTALECKGIGGQGWAAMQGTARALGIQLHRLDVREPDDYEGAFAAAISERAEAMVALQYYFNVFNLQRVVDLAAKYRLPAIYNMGEWVHAGGLMSYGPSFLDMFRRAATYVDKLLKGAKPADLPVEQPTKFELVINLKTAKALGITMPPSLLLLADEVIRCVSQVPCRLHGKVGMGWLHFPFWRDVRPRYPSSRNRRT